MKKGTLEQHADGTATIRFVRHLGHPIDKVWAAITEPAELRRWWGDCEVDLREGGSFDVRWLNTDDEGNHIERHAKITRLDPPRLLETDGDKHGLLRWELEPDGDGTTLTFTSTLDLPDGYESKVLAGWHSHLDWLADALEGRTTDLASVPGWEDVHREYASAVT